MRRHEGPFDELARELVVPAQSGIYIAKSEIIVLANLIEGSLRVNERSRMLADVLKSPDNLVDLARLDMAARKTDLATGPQGGAATYRQKQIIPTDNCHHPMAPD